MKANKVAEYLMDLLVSRTSHTNNAAVLEHLRSDGSDMSEQARLAATHANEDLLASQQAVAHQQLQAEADQLHAAQLHTAQLQAEAVAARQTFFSATQSAPAPRSFAPAPSPQPTHVTQEYVTQRHDYVTNNYRAGDNVVDNRTFTDIYARGNVKFTQDINNVTAMQGGVAAGHDISRAAVNTGEFKGIQAGNGPVFADHGVIGDGNTSVQGSHLGALGTNGGTANNVPGSAVFGSGSLNEIHGNGQVAQGGSSIVDVDNHGHGNLNFGNGTLNDVDTHGNGPVAVGHSSANEVSSSGSGQAVLGNGNHLTGDVSVDLHHTDGNANVAIGDHNGQSGQQVDNSQHVTDGSTRDSFNNHAETDDHSNHSVNDSANRTTVDDSFNHTTDNHDLHSVDDSYNHPTTTTVDDSNNHTTDSHNVHSVEDSYNHPTYDSHDQTHTVDDSHNHPTYDSHDLTHTVDDSYNHSWDNHDLHSVDDSYNHPTDSYNHSWDSHDLTHTTDDSLHHSWDLSHGHG
ncbi:MAG: hypothetical protein QOJ19_1563 [Acidimicrobiia bacterium]|nr:hypothetical protein [Acidimicrobiia bacterium]